MGTANSNTGRSHVSEIHRAKSLQDGSWVEGYLVRDDNGTPYILRDIVNAKHGENAEALSTMVEIAEQPIYRSLGRTDTQGALLFEGDIVASYARTDTQGGASKAKRLLAAPVVVFTVRYGRFPYALTGADADTKNGNIGFYAEHWDAGCAHRTDILYWLDHQERTCEVIGSVWDKANLCASCVHNAEGNTQFDSCECRDLRDRPFVNAKGRLVIRCKPYLERMEEKKVKEMKMRLSISKRDAKMIAQWLEEPGQSENETYYLTTEFPDGVMADIKCCGAQEEASWTEMVLFDAGGHELCCTEVCDTFIGEWALEYNGTNYVVVIEESEEGDRE